MSALALDPLLVSSSGSGSVPSSFPLPTEFSAPPAAVASSGSSTLGSLLQFASNTGLQWFNAASNGFTGPVASPAVVQATPGAALAASIPQLFSFSSLLVIGVVLVVGLAIFKKRR